MIQTGDKFTAKDLEQSIQELRSYDIQKHLTQHYIGIAIGNTLVTPCKCTPDEYYSICMREYNDIPSSAINLDKQLRDTGFKTIYRFSYKYRTPGLSHQQIIRDAYFLDWLRQIYSTTTPYEKYKAAHFRMGNDAFRISYYYAQYLWTSNRPACNEIAGKLRMPNVLQWEQIISAILGIGFQFHPDDIYEYSIEHVNPYLDTGHYDTRYAEQRKFKDQMMSDYGIDTGCLVLGPKNREKLQKIVTGTDTPYWIQVIQNITPWRNR